MNVSKEAQEALAAMAKAEEAWNKLAEETVQVSEQFVKEAREFQKKQREWFIKDVPNQPKQAPHFLP